MLQKGQFYWVKLHDVSLKAAIFIKQEMLSQGGEASVAHGVGDLSIEKTDIILMGTLKQYSQFIKKMKMQPFRLKEFAAELEILLEKAAGHHFNDRKRKKTLDLRGHSFQLGEKTLVMGILNVTPDSFSDGGLFREREKALEQARLMVEEGADILDVGGESTRPGHLPVGEEEEMERVMPVLEKLLQDGQVPVSIDTYKARVAEEALKVGAHLVNDVWGLKADPGMAPLIARYQVPVCIMHNRKDPRYQDLMKEITDDLRESLQVARGAGIQEERIILDPGIGFAKDPEENLEVMHRLEEIIALGYPLLLGTSRKSLIKKVLELPVDDRLEGTAATVALGIAKGVDIVRVHDVKYMGRVVKMTDAMVRR